MGKLNAVLVGLITPNQNEERTKEYLDELAFLADTNNTNCVKRFVQRLDYPNTSTYVGEGKLQEINEYIQRFAVLHQPPDLIRTLADVFFQKRA